MGTIGTSTGLISGLPTGDIIDQLIQVESRPKLLVENQIARLSAQKEAFQLLNTSMLAVRTQASLLNSSLVNKKSVASSDSSVLTASAGSQTPLGTFSFIASQLTSSQQTISRGFSDTATALGISTTLNLRDGKTSLIKENDLTTLNGGDGVERGYIKITDRAGSSATVDLSRAVTLDDVIEAINANAGVNVTASINDDGIQLTDNTGSTASNFIVENVGSKSTATDLGLVANVAASSINGTDINTINVNTLLTDINDGLGVIARGSGIDDFSIDDGTSNFNVTIDGATTIGDVIDAINNDAGNSTITASIAPDNNSLLLTSSVAGNVTVAALNSSEAADQLGILGGGSGNLDGERVNGTLGSLLLKNLGTSTALSTGLVEFTINDGVTTETISLTDPKSLSEVVDQINASPSNVTASINETSGQLELTNSQSGNGITVADTTGNLATVLGLAGTTTDDSLEGTTLAKFMTNNTALSTLNSGEGVAAGQFRITNSNGASGVVDLSQDDDTTIDDVIDEINGLAIGVTASINETGDGIQLTDTAGGTLQLRVEEIGNSTAADLGILVTAAGTGASNFINGSTTQSITIETSDTLDDIIQKINDADADITATVLNDGTANNPFRINFTSDLTGKDARFLIDDGDLDLQANTLTNANDATIFYGSNNAEDGLLIRSNSNTLDGVIAGLSATFSSASNNPVTVTVSKDTSSVGETIQGLVESFNGVLTVLEELDFYDPDTNEKGLLFGDPTISRITSQLFGTITNNVSAVDTEFSLFADLGVRVRDGKLEFNAADLQEALDRNPDAVDNLLRFTPSLTSGSDIADFRIAGTELTTDDSAGTNDIQITDKLGNAYQFDLDNFGSLGAFFTRLETVSGGNLTAELDGRRFVITDNSGGGGNIEVINLNNSLAASELGIDGSTSGTEVSSNLITINVENNSQLGLAGRLNNVLNQITNGIDGTIFQKTNNIDSQISLAQDRVDFLDARLDDKRGRLEAQFAALELALADIQNQQSALIGLAQSAASA